MNDVLNALVDQIADRVRSQLIAELPTLIGAAPQKDSGPQTDYFSEADIEARFSIKRRTLQGWRLAGKGPPWRKVERLVRYPAKDAIEFFRSP